MLKHGKVLLGGASIFMDVANRLRADVAAHTSSQSPFSGTVSSAIAEAFEVKFSMYAMVTSSNVWVRTTGCRVGDSSQPGPFV